MWPIRYSTRKGTKVTQEPSGLDVKAELASLDEGVQSVREKLAEEAVKRDERIQKSDDAIALAHGAATTANRTAKLATRIAAGAVVVGLIGVATGIVGLVQVHDANASRQTRTVAACEQANKAVLDRASDDKGIWRDVIERAIAGRSTNPALIDQFVRGTDAKIDRQAKDRLRDCSPAGLAKFYGKQATTSTTTHP